MRVLLLAFAALIPAFSQDTRVQLDTNATKVNFTLGDVLHTVHGAFKLKSGDFWFNPATGKAGGQLVVDGTSGQSGSGARDSRMNKNILESDKFPDIRFAPDRVEGAVNLAGDSGVNLHGMFTIHGGTHDVTMKVKSHIEGDRLTGTIAFDVPYVRWGMKNPSTLFLKVNDTVQIEIQASGRLVGGESKAPHTD